MHNVQTANAATPTRTDGVRQRLRAATNAVHADLHDASIFARLAAGTLDRTGYAAILRAHLCFHIHMAPAAGRAAAALGLRDIAARCTRRRRRLQHALAVLGIAPAAASAATIDSDGSAVGCMYTLLGAFLGGRVIHRQLDAVLTGEEGRSFFRGDPDDGDSWRLFCRHLESFGGQPGRMPALAAGALHAFADFRGCLETEIG